MGIGQLRSEPEKVAPLCMSQCGCRDDELKSMGSIVELEVDDDDLPNSPDRPLCLPSPMPTGHAGHTGPTPIPTWPVSPTSPAFRAPPAEVRGPTVFELEGSCEVTAL
ncbi:unnamed protein product [Symbiodinium natans]|uniref:Uncharacterized protein n=1 Tax=Symbiodinium natans TaxID=878477 RepID=A0A812KDS7_9DINO|nr:unnamed protein product [Symbiodinium natans]